MALATATVGDGDAAGIATGVAVKPGRHREASLYHALAGAGAGDGRSRLPSCATAAREAFEHSELPVWRRSGFWTTSFAELDLGARGTTRARARRRRAGVRLKRDPRPPARGADRAARQLDRARRAGSQAGRARRDLVLAGAGRERAQGAVRAVVFQAPDDRPSQVGGRQRRFLEWWGVPVRARRAARRGPL